MQSKIRIEYDFDTKQPVLRITRAEGSDDLRDQMLTAFLQKAGWTNSRLYISYPEYTGRKDNRVIEIRCEECEEDAEAPVSLEGAELPSRFQIGDEVDFSIDKWVDEAFEEAKRLNPSVPSEEIEYIPRYREGKVVAVKFTPGKVWYDILDNLTSEIHKEVVSHQTKKFSPEVRQTLTS